MDFYNRQYDPQVGRFMGIDPMADAAGQQGLSPYHAMACNPSTLTDPLGLYVKGEAHNGAGVPQYGNEMAMRFPTLNNFMARYLNFGERTASQSMAEQQIEAQEFHRKQHEEAASGTDDVRAMNARFGFSILVANLYGAITDKEQKNKSKDKKDDNIITYRLPISDELLNEYAKQADKQSMLGTECNILSLKFAALVLGVKDIEWEKAYEKNSEIKEYYKNSKELVEAAGFGSKRIGGLFPNAVGEYLNQGMPAFVMERGNGTMHRVVIVRIDYNIKNEDRSKVWVYDPNRGEIVGRTGFYNSNAQNTYIGLPISNNSFILFNKQ